MAEYEYTCECGEKKSIFRSMADTEVVPVCKCGKQMKRVFSAPIIDWKCGGGTKAYGQV